MWAVATCITGARGSCGMWSSETYALFIRGVKIASHIKDRLKRQLLDGDMQTHLMDKENWSRQVFDSINWRSYGTALKRLPRSRQTAVAKERRNLWYTGEKHKKILWWKETLLHVWRCARILVTYLCKLTHNIFMDQSEESNESMKDTTILLDIDRKSNKSLRNTPAQKR
jgi:hypothetical protein